MAGSVICDWHESAADLRSGEWGGVRRARHARRVRGGGRGREGGREASFGAYGSCDALQQAGQPVYNYFWIIMDQSDHNLIKQTMMSKIGLF